jgi:hypothetical protein
MAMRLMRRSALTAMILVAVACEHSAAPAAPAVRAGKDPVEALSNMAVTFLVDYFGNSAVGPDECLVDFWDGCAGKSAERDDIATNRRLLTIQSAEADVEAVHVFEDTGEADVEAACTFHDTLKSTGKSGTTAGKCRLTGVYRADRWWLCDSDFDGTRTCDDGTDDCNDPSDPSGSRFWP